LTDRIVIIQISQISRDTVPLIKDESVPDAEEEAEFSSPEQLSADLITLANLPTSRYNLVIHKLAS
jgi:hypothetical protein